MVIDFPHFSLEKRRHFAYDPTQTTTLESGMLGKVGTGGIIEAIESTDFNGGTGAWEFTGIVYGVFKGTEVGYVREVHQVDTCPITSGVVIRTNNFVGEAAVAGDSVGYVWDGTNGRAAFGKVSGGPFECMSVVGDGSYELIAL